MPIDINEYEINLEKLLKLNDSQRKYIDGLISRALEMNISFSSDVGYQVIALNTLINNDYLIDKKTKRDIKIENILS